VAPTPRTNLRSVAAAVLASWDDEENRTIDIVAALDAPMTALRTLLAERLLLTAAPPRKPREGTKQEAALTLFRRTQRATTVHIM
jgi:hypothetical protein